MSDPITFKEDLNKKKSFFGWLGFGKKNKTDVVSAPLVGSSHPSAAPSPFAPETGSFPFQNYQNMPPSMAKPVYAPQEFPNEQRASTPSFTDPASHTAALLGIEASDAPLPQPSFSRPIPAPPFQAPEKEVAYNMPPLSQPEAVSSSASPAAPSPAPFSRPDFPAAPARVMPPLPEAPEAPVPAPEAPSPLPSPEIPSQPLVMPAPAMATPPSEPVQPVVEENVAPIETFEPIMPAMFRSGSQVASVPVEEKETRGYQSFSFDPQDVTRAASFGPSPDIASRPNQFSLSSSSESEAVYEKGIATLRDLIAPPAIRLTPTSIQIGEVAARTHFIVAYPKYLGTNWFSPIVNMDTPMDIAFFIHPIDTRDIVKDLRKAATQVQSQINIEAQDGKIRDPVLESAMQNIEELRDKLQQGTEKFFRFGLYMTMYAADDSALNELSKTIESILEAQLVFTKPAVLRMDQGFIATRPLAMDALDIANNLNTSPLSTTFPFVSSDLSSDDGVLYGINRHNNSLVLFDRFKMENANMVVFAKSGAGKSYTIKLEVLRSMMFGTMVIIIDPENEYKHLCETVGGTFMSISLNSEAHLNPFDLPRVSKEEADEEGVLRSHIANLIGLLHLMLGSVTPEEDSILDRAIRETYAIRDITEMTNYSTLTATSYPTMQDLYEVLRNLEGAESLASRLERYTEGVFGGFLNHQTNISMDKQLIVFNIRDLENELRPIAMYIVLQYIWNEMRATRKQRMVVVDEAWIMMQNEDAGAFLFGIAKRCRKYYTGLTTITQDIADFMSSRYGKPIVTNSSMQLLLKQSPASVDLIAETFYLTDHEKFLLLESSVGEGIFFAGTKHVAIKVIASYSEDQIITTDPRQLAEIDAAKKEFDDMEGQ